MAFSFTGVKGLSQYNKKVINYIQKSSLQQKNKWDFLIFSLPTLNFSSGLSSVTSAIGIAGVALDMVVSKVFVQSVQFHAGINFSAERVSADYYIKDVDYPESVTITFFDTEEGISMRYIQEWMNQVAQSASFFDSTQGYVFSDDQESAKKTGILLLNTSEGKSLKYPRVTFYGMVPKNPGDIHIVNNEDGYIEYSVEFFIREVRVSVII